MRALEAGDRDADAAGAPANDLPVARPITHWRNSPAPTTVLWRDIGEVAPSGTADEVKDAICSSGEQCIIAAPGGSGKSYLTLGLAATAVGAASCDAAFGTACGLWVRPGPVVLLSYEDRPRRTWHRFRHVASSDNCNILDDAQASVHVIDPAAPLYDADFAEVDHRFRGCGSRISVKWSAHRSVATFVGQLPPIGVVASGRYPTRAVVSVSIEEVACGSCGRRVRRPRCCGKRAFGDGAVAAERIARVFHGTARIHRLFAPGGSVGRLADVIVMSSPSGGWRVRRACVASSGP